MTYRSSFLGSLLVVLAIAVACSTAGAQTYGGQATVVRATVNVVGDPLVTTAVADTGPLPDAGGTITLTSVGVSVAGGIVSVGSSTAETSGAGNMSESTASVNNLNIGVLSNTITADVISSQTDCVCPGSVASGSSTITNLQINGIPVTITGAPNQQVTILLAGNPVGTLTINEQILEPRGITINALHLFVTDPLDATTTDVIVASARSSINCLLSPLDNLVSGRGTGVRLTESDILTGHITTIISDTGPLPMAGGAIMTTTTGAGLAPILSTGVVEAETSGGLPGGEDTTQSSSTVDDLAVDLLTGTVTIDATVLTSDTECACSLSVGSCSGGSSVAGLAVTALGLPVVVNVTGAPNQVVNIPVLGFGSVTLVINEQVGSPNGNPADLTVNALRIITNLTGLVATDIVIASAHSDIVCGVAPTAAGATIVGRVTTQDGRGLGGASIGVSDSDGTVRRAITNPFGYYTLENVEVGQTYVMEASHRRYSFSPRVVTVDGDLAGVDFTPDGGAKP